MMNDRVPPMLTLLQPGDDCGGYRIVRLIGTGRIAHVYEGQEPGGPLRAIKHMSAPRAEKIRARFAQEGEAIVRIVHPNVVRLYDAGACGDQIWLVLELIE